MTRSLSLRTWLALGLLLALAAPLAAGLGAWFAAGAWQTGRENARASAALRVLASGPVETEPGSSAVLSQLSDLGVEADIVPIDKLADKQAVSAKVKQAYESSNAFPLSTPGVLATLKS
ncbi:MAG TPA: hypothetical protein VI300_24235, partial [Solirubrobacter sp.]